jgi:hypothetical protein
MINSAIHTPTAIPTGTDSSLTMITGVSIITDGSRRRVRMCHSGQ